MPNLQRFRPVLKTLGTGAWSLDGRAGRWLEILLAASLPLVGMWVAQTLRKEADPLQRAGQVARAVVVLLLVAAMMVLRVQDRIEFIYFQF